MCRSITTSEISVENIHWSEDCICIVIPRHKADQGGENTIYAHCYSNPIIAEMDLFLALGNASS